MKRQPEDLDAGAGGRNNPSPEEVADQLVAGMAALREKMETLAQGVNELADRVAAAHPQAARGASRDRRRFLRDENDTRVSHRSIPPSQRKTDEGRDEDRGGPGGPAIPLR